MTLIPLAELASHIRRECLGDIPRRRKRSRMACTRPFNLSRPHQAFPYVLVPAGHAEADARHCRYLSAIHRRRCAMTPIAPHITAFFQKRLAAEQAASPQTCDTYAYAFQLLFEFM